MGNSTGYGSSTTAEEAINKRDLSGQIIVVTGANTGLGKETARVCLKQGATVIMACRSQERGDKARTEILETFKNNDKIKKENLDLILCDLGNLESIRNFGLEFRKKYQSLNILINNAGVMAFPEYGETSNGFERQFGINHIGHSYLTFLLTPFLLKSKTSRLIQVSSTAHSYAPKPFGNTIELYVKEKRGPNKKDKYGAWLNYGTSKISNILFAREFNEEYKSKGLTGYSLHPGVIATELSRNMGSFKQWAWKNMGSAFLKSIPQGAATTCRIVGMTDEELKELGGAYFHDCNPRPDKLRSDVRPDKNDKISKLSKQFYQLTKELIQAKGFPLDLDSPVTKPKVTEEETKEDDTQTQNNENTTQETNNEENKQQEQPQQEEQQEENNEEPQEEQPDPQPQQEDPPQEEQQEQQEEPQQEENIEEQPQEEQPTEEPQEENNE